MSVILVVETDASYAQRISEAMQSAGLAVEVCENAESAGRRSAIRPPQLLVASSAVPDVRSLLARFARAQGGPGAVVMIPTTLVGRVSARDYHADAILPKPFSPAEAQKILLPMLAAEPTPRERRQLSSAEIFGDVLAEVEDQIPPPAAGSTAAPKTDTPPASKPAVPAVPPPPAEKPAAPRPRSSSNDVDRKLEETLSGVLPLTDTRKRVSGAEPPRPRARSKPDRSQEIDALLDKTLSSLELPSRTRRKTAASRGEKPTAPNPAPPAPSPPSAPSMKPAPPAQATPRTSAAFATTTLPTINRPDDPSPPAPPPGAASISEGSASPGSSGPGPANAVSPGSGPPPSLRPSAFATTTLPAPGRAGVPPAEAMPRPPAVPRPRPPAEPPEAPLPPAEAALPPIKAAPLSESLPQPEVEPPAPDNFRTRRLNIIPARETAEGEIFGDYTLLKRIAIGGMAEVWQARRRGVEGFQKTVAIKKILSHLTGSSDFVTMFIDEAKLAAQLNHNNIIQIYDLGKVGEDFFIAMEYVDGMDLRTILNTARNKLRPLPMRLSLLIASSVARALDYAHRKRDFDNRALGLVHRDVSPQNILISHEGEIKLCDFGIVKAVAKASTTQMGALKGKLQYMSPEQAWGKPVDARSDIFSLGSVIFEMLSGRRLFSGDSEIGVLDAVRECRVKSPRELVPEVPEDVDRIVRRALTKEPEERYQTAGEMDEDLKSVIFSLKPMPSQGEVAGYMQELAAAPVAEEEAPAARSVAAPSLPGFESPPASAPTRSPAPAAFFTSPEARAEADSLPAAAPAPETEPAGTRRKSAAGKERGGIPWGKFLLAALLLAALGVAAFFIWRSSARSPALPAAPAAADRVPETAEPGETPPGQGSLSEVGGSGDQREEVPAEAVSGSQGEDSGSQGEDSGSQGEDSGSQGEDSGSQGEDSGSQGEDEATPPETGADLDLQDLVGQEMARQKEEIKKKLDEEFEAEKRKLEQELEKAKKTSEEGGGGRSEDR